MSLLDLFDDLISKYDYLVNNLSVTEEFYRFVVIAEENRIRWMDDKKQIDKLKKDLEETQKQLELLENRNDTTRRLFDKEKAARLKAEKELQQKVKLINTVMETMVADENNKISEETKLQLSDIKNSFRCKEKPAEYNKDYGGRLSMISEGDTNSSIISDLSYSMSEDLSEDNVLDYQPRRSVRKSHKRNSLRLSDAYNRGPRRSDQLQRGEKFTATSKVTFDKYGVTSASARVDVSPPRKSRRTSEVLVPSVQVISPTAPTHSTTNSASTSVEDFLADHENDEIDIELSPKLYSKLAVEQIHARQHSTQCHKCILPTPCVVCNKRMNYTTSTVKCTYCKVILHASCEINLPLPCVPVGSGTPAQISKKHLLNVLASYCPAEPPLIPPLVIHCVLEVEKRGFQEEGIYRKNGNPDQVKELKKELLSTDSKQKVDHLLSTADINSVACTLKDFLRGLDEPLIPNSMWDWFTDSISYKDIDEINLKLIVAIGALPQPNKETLAYLMLHLQRLEEFSSVHKMGRQNLAIIFGPSVIGYSNKDPVQNCAEIDIANQTVACLLGLSSDYWNTLIAGSGTHIMQTTPCSKKIVHHTPSTDSLVSKNRVLNRMTTPKLFHTEKKKYLNKPKHFRF